MRALALKYRPMTFDDVVEQRAIKQILQEQVATKTHKNAYLFTGGAGTGKTTCARILANEINDQRGSPIEIDAASNNGVDDVREIINDAKFKALDAEYKVYILDECHMFSTGAWNAMLKLIEEPPAKTIFIFCTTDPQKIPATILSRVQRYDFQRITYAGILNQLVYIMEEGEGLAYEMPALEYIAKLAEGGMRDAITLLDKCLSFSETLTLKGVIEALGAIDYDTMFDILGYLLERRAAPLLFKIDEIHKSGVDLKQFIKQFGWFVLDVCKYEVLDSFEQLQIPETYESSIKWLMDFSEGRLLEILREVLNINNLIKWEANAKALIEASFVLYCEGEGESNV